MGSYSVASQLATVQPLVGTWKGDVMQLAQHVGVPADVLASSRASDPKCGRMDDEAAIGLERVDYYAKCRLAGRSDLLAAELTKVLCNDGGGTCVSARGFVAYDIHRGILLTWTFVR